MRYSDLDKAALQAELSHVQQDYEALRGYKLNLNLTRGKPETAQLALSNDMFRTLISTPRFTIEANDVRKKPMELVNSNRLISDDPTSECYSSICIGGKTGSTDRGGDCLVSVGGLDGARVICVLIGADDTNHRDANKRMPKVF